MIGPAARDARSDRANVKRIVAASGSSFAFGMRIMTQHRRRAVRAVYAFCRIVDDIADGDMPGSHDPGFRAASLDAWEEEIMRAYDGLPRTAVGAELARAIDRHQLPQAEFLLLIDGMRMDADRVIAPSDEKLAAYIRRVAGSVGLLSMRCFGAWQGETSERFALALARGLQLTNILRDTDEDARLGRLYLPRHVLEATGLPADPAAALHHPAMPRARAMLGVEARTAFTEAALEIPAHSRARLLPALLMMGPYERLLTRMEADWTIAPGRRSTFGKLVDGTRLAALGGR